MGRVAALFLWGCLAVFGSSRICVASDKQLCQYIDAQGKLTLVDSEQKVPASLRSSARCFTLAPSANSPKSSSDNLASPEELTLKGSVREENMLSSVGHIKLRWPRSVEVLFGRTPQKAMAEAAQTVSRALRQGGFPTSIQSLSLDWQVVFMDADLPATQIPSYLIHNCHPGWMTPPANIYIVAQRVTSGCSGARAVASRVGDVQLTQVLIHEMGHAVEYQLFEGLKNFDRMRSEGFATWFEDYASDYSSIVPHGQAKERTLALARQSLKHSATEFNFQGSAEDYSRAALYFMAVVDRRGISGLMDVYRTMQQQNLSFVDAIKERFNWTDKQLQKEIERCAKL